MGRVDGLAHRDPHQQLPEVVAARQRRGGPLLADAEALVHALQHVLLVLATADSPVQVSAGQDQQAREKCALAKQFENAGDYEEARRALTGLWSIVGERPVVTGLEPATKAELLLRVGSLSGWIGSAQQIATSQEFA